MENNTRKITYMAMLIGIGVALSTFYIPIGGSKCFPVQHFINVFTGIILGPIPAVICAFCTSLLRILMGTGTVLAFPGSMIGAFLSGIFFKITKKIWAGCIGEVVGTGVIGAIVAFIISTFILGNKVASYAFIIPFSISSVAGGVMGTIIVYIMARYKKLEFIKNSKDSLGK